MRLIDWDDTGYGWHLTEMDGQRLEYRKDRLRNPSVMAFGDNSINWPEFFGGS